MHFEIVGEITAVVVVARGVSVRQRSRLNRHYGRGRWRKVRGQTVVKLSNGSVRQAEIHWYEARGIGSREFKVKRFLDQHG